MPLTYNIQTFKYSVLVFKDYPTRFYTFIEKEKREKHTVLYSCTLDSSLLCRIINKALKYTKNETIILLVISKP